MSFLDRGRAETLLGDSGAEALVLFQPENFSYATGAAPGMANMWRRGGAAIALVPADRSLAAAAIVGDLHADMMRVSVPHLELREHRLWIDTVDIRGVDRRSRGAAEIVQQGYAAGKDDGAPARPPSIRKPPSAFSEKPCVTGASGEGASPLISNSYRRRTFSASPTRCRISSGSTDPLLSGDYAPSRIRPRSPG